MSGKAIIFAGLIVAIAIVVAAIIMQPARYRPMKISNDRSVVLDAKTGLIYPRGTGAEPLLQKK